MGNAVLDSFVSKVSKASSQINSLTYVPSNELCEFPVEVVNEVEDTILCRLARLSVKHRRL